MQFLSSDQKQPLLPVANTVVSIEMDRKELPNCALKEMVNLFNEQKALLESLEKKNAPNTTTTNNNDDKNTKDSKSATATVPNPQPALTITTKDEKGFVAAQLPKKNNTPDNPQFVSENLGIRAMHHVAAAKFFYTSPAKAVQENKEARQTAFNAAIDAAYEAWKKSLQDDVKIDIESDAKEQLKNLCDALQKLISQENVICYSDTSKTVLIEELDALLTMQENAALFFKTNNAVITESTISPAAATATTKTVTVVDTKASTSITPIKLKQEDIPSFDLSDEQLTEYKDLLDDKKEKPLWFRKFCLWRQEFILDTLRSLKEKHANNENDFNTAICRQFGHPPANMRHQLGLSNYFDSRIYVNDILLFEGVGSSFPGPQQTLIEENNERVRLIKSNLKQSILKHLPGLVSKFCEKHKPEPGTTLPIPIFIQSLLSPLFQDNELHRKFQTDNNYKMVQTLRQAIIELHAEFPPMMLIEGRVCTLKFITTNRPVNKFRNGRHDARWLDSSATNTHESLELLASTKDFLPFIKKELSPTNQIICTALDELLTGITDIDKKTVETRLANFLPKLTTLTQEPGANKNFAVLVKAICHYLSLIYTNTKDLPHGLNKQLFLASLEKIIGYLIGGYVHFFCKSGQDRKGFTADDLVTHLAYEFLFCTAFNFADANDCKKFIELFSVIVKQGHNDRVREIEAPGSATRKEEKNIAHKAYVKAQDEKVLARKKVVAKLSKPAEKITAAMKSKDTQVFVDNGAAVTIQGHKWRRKHGCTAHPCAYFMSMGNWRCPIDLNALAKYKDVLAFDLTATPSLNTFLIWLSIGEQIFTHGKKILQSSSALTEMGAYELHTTQIIKLLEKAREYTVARYIPLAVYDNFIKTDFIGQDFTVALKTFAHPTAVRELNVEYSAFYQQNPTLRQDVLQLVGVQRIPITCSSPVSFFKRVSVPPARLDKFLTALNTKLDLWKTNETLYLDSFDFDVADYQQRDKYLTRDDLIFKLFLHLRMQKNTGNTCSETMKDVRNTYLGIIVGECFKDLNLSTGNLTKVITFHADFPRQGCCQRFGAKVRDATAPGAIVTTLAAWTYFYVDKVKNYHEGQGNDNNLSGAFTALMATSIFTTGYTIKEYRDRKRLKAEVDEKLANRFGADIVKGGAGSTEEEQEASSSTETTVRADSITSSATATVTTPSLVVT